MWKYIHVYKKHLTVYNSAGFFFNIVEIGPYQHLQVFLFFLTL